LFASDFFDLKPKRQSILLVAKAELRSVRKKVLWDDLAEDAMAGYFGEVLTRIASICGLIFGDFCFGTEAAWKE
jgi:hypothetical protein